MSRYETFKGKATRSDAGQAGEHLVAHDLLKRGLWTTKPLNTNGPHDIHAKMSGQWRTLQVKLGRVNTKTGTVMYPRSGRKNISSDILALVDLKRVKIRYIPMVGELPSELLDD